MTTEAGELVCTVNDVETGLVAEVRRRADGWYTVGQPDWPADATRSIFETKGRAVVYAAWMTDGQ